MPGCRRPFFKQCMDTHGNQVYAVTKDGQRFLVNDDATEVQWRGAADRRPQLDGRSTGSEAGAFTRGITDESVAEIVQRKRLAGSVGSRQRPGDDVVPLRRPEPVVPAGRHDDELATLRTQLVRNRSAMHARRELEPADALTRRRVVDAQNGPLRASVEHESTRCRQRRSVARVAEIVGTRARRHRPRDLAFVDIDRDEATPRRAVAWQAIVREQRVPAIDAVALRRIPAGGGKPYLNPQVVHGHEQQSPHGVERAARPVGAAAGRRMHQRALKARRSVDAVIAQFRQTLRAGVAMLARPS